MRQNPELLCNDIIVRDDREKVALHFYSIKKASIWLGEAFLADVALAFCEWPLHQKVI